MFGNIAIDNQVNYENRAASAVGFGLKLLQQINDHNDVFDFTTNTAEHDDDYLGEECRPFLSKDIYEQQRLYCSFS